MKHTIDFSKIDKTKYYFDEEAGNDPIRFIETFIQHTKGKMAGKPYLLQDWEKNIVSNLFGWKKRSDGLRKFKELFLMLPRKNSKTTLSSALMLYLLIVNTQKDKGGEVYLGAGSREQARIAFTIIKQMVQNEHQLNKVLKLYQNSIEFEKTQSFLKVVSSESGNLLGANLSAALVDEYLVHKDSTLYDVFKTSMGTKEEPLLITITTAGDNKNSACYELYDYGKKIIDEIIEDESFLSVIYEGVDSDDLNKVFHLDNFKLANPSYGKSIREEYIIDQINKAKSIPSYVNTVKQLHLNIWVDSSSAWISNQDWMVNKVDYTEEDLLGETCWAGLDLANNRDLNSFVLLFPQSDGKFKVLNYTFIPVESANRKDNIAAGQAFIGWSNQPNNLLYLTQPRSRDDDFIFNKIKELSEKFNIVNIAYDRWGADQLVFKLETELGLKFSSFGQGYKSQSPAIKATESLIIEGKLLHNNNPVIKWCISNVRIVKDDAGNVKMSKERSKEKIDAAVALVMAIGQYNLDKVDDMVNEENQKSPYTEDGFFFL